MTRRYEKLQELIKEVADRCLAFVLLLLFSPLMLAIAIAIYFSMGRPVIFAQPRPGKGAKIFTFYKFRTMVSDECESVLDNPNYTGSAPPDSQRITPLGQFLRKTSLDELPQLWNVLKGDMSLVGPRPLRAFYLCRYSAEQARRHDVKPGVTGLVQVNGRNALTWERKFELDVWYVDHRNLWLDLKILFLTVFKVLQQGGIRKEGAYTEVVFRGSLGEELEPGKPQRTTNCRNLNPKVDKSL
ncbi:MAG: sugar transferase [Mycobacterium sp.]|nr:sugar transferase [Mycobacterium sp.]